MQVIVRRLGRTRLLAGCAQISHDFSQSEALHPLWPGRNFVSMSGIDGFVRCVLAAHSWSSLIASERLV
jgi:hypothetical protein